ncbi:MAG: hypothetical protein JST00_27195 [Deltaproteobacteria bacterium]|nr:hypothetical protein [Deltaproteobacteria bacterium]
MRILGDLGARARAVRVVVPFLAFGIGAPSIARADEPPAASAPSTPSTPAAPGPAPARPEPSAGDLATARMALREGLSLRESGDLNGALGRLQTAYDLVPTPITAFELGKTHMMMGKVLQAHELFKKISRMPSTLEESPRSVSSREEAARLASDLEPRIPTLRIRMTLAADATASVRVDDDPITLVPGTPTPRAVDPGKHLLVAKAGDGPEQRVTIEIGEGETRDVELAPQWIPPRPKATADGKNVVLVRTTNPLVFVGFTLSGASFTIATVATVVAINAAERAKDRCGAAYCSPAVQKDDLQQAKVWTAAAGITAAASIGFAALGILSLNKPVTEKVTATGPTVQPYVGLGGAGLRGSF